MDIAALIGSLVAVLVATISAGYTRSQAKATKDQATEAKRANDRLDRIDAEAVRADAAEAERNRINWFLQDRGSRQWTLWNRGTDTASQVRLRLSNGVLRVSGHEVRSNEVVLPEVRPNHPVTLTVVPTPSWGNTDPPKLEIWWDGCAEPEVEVFPSS